MEGNGFMAKARKGDKGEQYKSALATRLRDQIDKGPKTKLVDIADATGISRQTISQYTGGETQPSADNLSLIADYFNVSTDYLLGRTDVSTTDMELQQICKYIGLSPEAVTKLRNLKGDLKTTLNQILEHDDFTDLLRAIHSYAQNYNEGRYPKIDKEEAGQLAKLLSWRYQGDWIELAGKHLKANSQLTIESTIMEIVQRIKVKVPRLKKLFSYPSERG